MRNKKPTEVPAKDFFGKYWDKMSEAWEAEKFAAGQGEEEKAESVPAGLLALLASYGHMVPDSKHSPKLLHAVRNWWPVQLLREAAEKKDAEGFKRLLHYFLLDLLVSPPEGVLIPFRWKTGRPNETEKIYVAWVMRGEPVLDWRTCDDLAKEFYAKDFKKAASDPKLRKTLRDRVRATILRNQTARATNSPLVS